MSSKFGVQIVFDFLKTMTSHNRKPEVVLRRRTNSDEFKNDRNNHITVIGMLFCISLPNCIEIGPPEADDVLSIFKMAAEFKGSVETAHIQVMTGLCVCGDYK